MVAPDDDRRTELTRGDEPVELEPGPGTFPVAQPADPCRQPLERDLRLGHRDPAPEADVIGEELQDRRIRPSDVGWIAGQCSPTERAATLAEQRPHERRNEAGV